MRAYFFEFLFIMHAYLFLSLGGMKAEETIDFPIRWAWHKISRLYNLEASTHGITMSIGYCLLNIDRKNGTPSTKLGPLMGMESRSLTRTLKTMENMGLIERVADKKDKRMVRIFLTQLGVESREISRNTVIQFNEVIKAGLTKKELEQFFTTMQKINRMLDESKVFQVPNMIHT